jgi:outer membrane protein assembly factor BamB
MKATHLRICQILALGGVFPTLALAGDWPQWRGPTRDGIASSETSELRALPRDPEILWRMRVGEGHSGPLIVGGKLVYTDQVEGKEIAHQVDLKTRKEIWRKTYDPNPAEYGNFGQGPRSTATVDGDRLYVQSGRGKLACLSMKDGSALWAVDFEKDFGATWFGNKKGNPASKGTAAQRHGNNGAPAILGDRIFAGVGDPQGATLVAFNKFTGKKLWQAGNDRSAYSSLMAGKLGGVDHVIHYNADALVGADAASGDILFRFPIKTGAKRHTVTPILTDDSVWVSSHNQGQIKTRVNGRGKAENAWTNAKVKTMLATPVLVGGHLYGLGTTAGKSTDFVCVDFETGEEKWNQSRAFPDYASIIVVGDKLLALNSTGELLLIKANPEKYEELGRIQACGKTHSHPAYVDGVLYARDARQIVALKLR